MEHNAITDSEETTVDNDSGLAKVRYGHNTPRKNHPRQSSFALFPWFHRQQFTI